MPVHQARGMGVAWPPPPDTNLGLRDTATWLTCFVVVGPVRRRTNPKTGEEQWEGVTNGFVVSGSFEPMST